MGGRGDLMVNEAVPEAEKYLPLLGRRAAARPRSGEGGERGGRREGRNGEGGGEGEGG
jgi:hypothetical protein